MTKNPHRILYVLNHAGFFLSHRLPLALAARDAGYEVHVATPPSRHVAELRSHGLPWHPVKLTRSGKNPLAELQALASLVRLYRSLRPELVHQVTAKPVLYGTVAARLTRVPAVVNAFPGLGHLGTGLSDSRASGGALGRALSFGYRATHQHPRLRSIFQNTDDRDIFLRNGWLEAGQAVLIKGSGVDTSAFAPSVRPTRPPLVVLASRMIATKGIEDFVEAARRLKRAGLDARFALVGEPDPDNPASIPEHTLQAWASEGVVEYWGRHQDMPRVFAQSDIACLPTFYREGVPKFLIEAACCGLPIVTTNVPGCRDLVVDGETGFVVPPRDVDALVAALTPLIQDSKLRLRLGTAGRVRTEGEYSLRHVIAATLDVYRGLLS